MNGVNLSIRAIAEESVSTRSHAPRGNAVLDALRRHFAEPRLSARGACKTAFPRGAWERGYTSICGSDALRGTVGTTIARIGGMIIERGAPG